MDKQTIDNNCELLFEYLKSALYDKKPKRVELDKLEPEFQKLGQGIAYTQALITEMLHYSCEISQGNLNIEQPSRGNFLCSNLKNLNSNLQHLTWQAKQVAKGDYTQHVSYLGEFSDAFNQMISQLKEREEAIKRRTVLMEEYNRFFLEVSSKRDEGIFIVQEDTRELLYCNRKDVQDGYIKLLIQNPEADQFHQKEVRGEKGKYYEVSAFCMEWQEKKATGFVVRDITKEKVYSNNLTEIAYNDALTGVKNRQYFDEYLRKADFYKCWDIFCYMDLDGLKYVNDNYGHDEGDRYIQSFAKIIQKSFRSTDILFRIGGDEFCMFCKDMSFEILTRKLERIRAHFIAENHNSYDVSFSYGVVENAGTNESFENVMKLADENMYQYKKIHKKNRRDT